jgi:hypothetical protein
VSDNTPPHDSPWARIPVGLEASDSGYVHAHALTLPGLVATGFGAEDALGEFEHELPRWLGYLRDIGEPVPSLETEIRITVDEWVSTDVAVAAGESDAFFAADEEPLTDTEIRRGLALIGEMRAPLLPRIRRAKDADLEDIPAGSGHLRQVIDELARAQWWLLTRLGSSPLGQIPDTAVGRLDTAMALTIDRVAHLSADERAKVVEIDGEIWSPRKVLRRLVWIEATLGDLAMLALRRHGGEGA